jgi:adenine deaminase
LPRDVVIAGRLIGAVTPWDHFRAAAGIEELNARGKFVSPGFIDAHIHVEYTKLTPGELARLSIPRRTTTILADANCIGNVFGREWISWVRSITGSSCLGE